MIKASITITPDKGEAKIYQLTQTAEASKNKDGKMSLAQFQPAPDNTVVKAFSKLYIDTEALGGKAKK